ncbi:MAG: response regulator [Candidatus Omnitrophota bacterium]
MKRKILNALKKYISNLGFKISRQKGLGKTIFLWFITLSLLPLLIASVVSYSKASQILSLDAVRSLETVSKLKQKYIDTFFTERVTDLQFASHLISNVSYLKEVNENYKRSGMSLPFFLDTERYATKSLNITTDLDSFRKTYGYQDLYLIDLNGNILLAVNDESMTSQNIFHGSYSKSLLAQACRKTIQTGNPVFSDIEFVDPNQKNVSAFLVQVMTDQTVPSKEAVGIIAVKMSMDQINIIMQENPGGSRTGRTYLIGEDLRLRSRSMLGKQEGIILKTRIDTQGTRQWLNKNQNEVMKYSNYNREDVLGVSYDLNALKKYNVRWGLIAEVNESEALASALSLRMIVGLLVLATIILVSAISIFASKRIVNPILKLSDWAQRVAIGDLSYYEFPQQKNEIGQTGESFKKVVDSLQAVTDVCETIALGDFTKTVDIRSDNDTLGKAVNQMKDNLEEVVRQANSIAMGDYSVNIRKRSEKDRLSDALNRMTQALRHASEEDKKQNWLKTGQGELNNRMRGQLDIPELAQNIISLLTSYLGAQIGLLYFVSRENILKLVGNYALGKERNMLRKFRFGEGLVGQAAKENRVIEVTQIPGDLVKLRTGFGEIIPKSILIAPFNYEGAVIGVIEIASLREFTDIEREFIYQSLENIAIALNSAESRREMKELLKKSQDQAEKLQQQQEELRQSNEELEGQTRALIASETNLQSQQEELRVINEELEERTRALEKQKTDIQQKNIELLMARNEIEKKARALEEVSKYKSEFLANMSHELRTPLNSILILSQLLSNNSDGNLTGKQVEFAKTIHSSGSDLLTLINEILDLSKIEAGMMEIRIENILIDELVASLQRIFKPVAASKKLDFLIDVDKNALPEAIDTDSQRAQQILKNLLSNAFKFTEKGSVTIRIARPPQNTQFSQEGLSPEHTVAISVIDTGIGIPGDKQAIIFEAFRQEDGTTSRKYGGTGLGLSISRELAWLLGGEIQMQSERGKGSIFTLFLPEKIDKPGKRMPLERRKPATSPLPAEHPEANAPSVEPPMLSADPLNQLPPPIEPIEHAVFEKKEIQDDRESLKPEDKSLLVIEDDTTFAEVLLRLAQNKGFKCLIAEDGETGLHFADFYKPSAIILDVKLPGMDGWQVLERLKSNAETRHIPVHLMSAVENLSEAMNRGAIGYLNKPIDTNSLDSAFKKIERIISKPVKRILIIDNDEDEKRNIVAMVDNTDVETLTVSTATDALLFLKKGNFDCMILNLELADMGAFEFLERISEDEASSQIPVIVYSEKELDSRQQDVFKRYAQRIMIRNVQSLDALFAETTLFLHRVEADLPGAKKRMMNRMLDKESVMKGKKVLIVDDDMRNVFALTSILEERGMKTVVGKNGKEGIEKLNEEPDIDLVLMDIMMPVMDGYEAMRHIRKDRRFEKLPIIALTAKAMKGDRNKCVSAGASDYVAKPVDGSKLLSLLRVWLYE